MARATARKKPRTLARKKNRASRRPKWRLAILSRNRGLHSTQGFVREAKRAGIDCQVIDPLDCQLMVDSAGTPNTPKTEERSPKGSRPGTGVLPAGAIYTANGEIQERFDAVLPRIGASITDYGIAVVQQFEMLGTYPINSANSIALSRDKFRCLQVLAAAGVPTPRTAMLRNPRLLRSAAYALGGLPLVLKLLRGTQGLGVMLVNAPNSLESVFETLRGLDQDILIQQFVTEGAGRDYRVFVVGGKVVGAMMRTAAEGEFRANIHRGAQGRTVKLPKQFEAVSLKAARVLGLEVAGVDLMASNQGPLVLEVNSSPGFEGLERATGINVAKLVVAHVLRQLRSKRRGLGRKSARR